MFPNNSIEFRKFNCFFMKKNTFKSYKEEIIKRYSLAQAEDLSGILTTPTPAQLRDFCVMKCDKGLTKADEELMKAFFRTKSSESLKHSIELCNIDKFRPIISFLKNEKDTENQIRVGLAAIIVDFNPRPFAKFSGLDKEVMTEESISKHTYEEIIQGFKVEDEPSGGLYKRWLYLILGILGLFSFGYAVKSFVSPEKQCMQWQDGHYELVDCSGEINSLYSSAPIVPFDDKAQELNKLTVCDTTPFFEGGKPKIWYCKVNGKPEFFDGPGLHPITGKGLKPVTPYIINKYVKKK